METEEKQSGGEGQIKEITDLLLMKIEERLRSPEAISDKDLRTYTGALKDIRELRGGSETEENRLIVSFAGERAEQASR